MGKILIVEDDSSLREILGMFLTNEGHEVALAATGNEALDILSKATFDLVITDLKLGKVSGLDVLSRTKALSPDTEVIVITAYSTVETAIEAMRNGAFDYIQKPFRNEQLSLTVEKALEKRTLSLENLRLRKELGKRYRFDRIVGRNGKMQKVFRIVEQVAPTRASVLITGESGTGKELVARAIHYNSSRRGRPFVVVNCAAIPDTLMESELFGHLKGAFTGAHLSKRGLLESANGGTVFFDEVGELSPPMQVKLLRFLQDRTIRRVGGTEEIEIDVRIVAATNKDLQKEVEMGTFREDLFYRLNVIRIHLPPLRERRDDIPLLVTHFVEKYARELGRNITKVADDVMGLLTLLDYHGNVRELENVCEHAVTFALGDTITMDALPEHVRGGEARGVVLQDGFVYIPDGGLDLQAKLAEIEKNLLVGALRKTGGVKKAAASLLGISFRSMRYKLAKYGLAKDSTEKSDQEDLTE